MGFVRILACIGVAMAMAGSAAFAQTGRPVPAQPDVLAPADIQTYRDIFALQEKGRYTEADRLIAKIEDQTLLGYVLQQRYLGSGYTSKYQELAAWLQKYGDHVDANRVRTLAAHKRPKGARALPAVTPAGWRGERFDGEVSSDLFLKSRAAGRLLAQLRSMTRRNDPQGAEAALRKVKAGANLPQADLDRLSAYIATYYLASSRDEDALRIVQSLIARNASNVAHARWIAGLANYRTGSFPIAAAHFEAMAGAPDPSARNVAGGSFWAARAWMQAGNPERVVALLAQAADGKTTFYGILSAHLLGQEIGLDLVDPELDREAFNNLMTSPAARRAVALWQVGEAGAVERELGRAFAETPPDLDPAFAALARQLDVPTLELRAAETSAHQEIFLTSLYPIPSYVPEDGFQIDRAVLFAFARQESRFDHDAVSSAGARGLMQLMPQTAVGVARDRTLANKNRAKLNDPVFSLTLGQRYLQRLLDLQGGNLVGLAAAYNAGPGNFSRWLDMQPDKTDPLIFIETIPAAETRDYIRRVLINLWMYRQRLEQPIDGLDDLAGGHWPQYRPVNTITAAR